VNPFPNHSTTIHSTLIKKIIMKPTSQRIRTILSTLALAAATPLVGQAADGPSKPTPPEGGEVFAVIEGRDRQIYFESNAPLEDIKGQSNQVIGYSVVDDEGELVSGEWWVPVQSLRTGIELRDEHLHGKDWLHAEENSYIKVRLTEVENWTDAGSNDAFQKGTADLVGEVEINGVTRPVSAEDATVTILPESDRTKAIAPGDLMAVQATFIVVLADHEVSHPVIGEKVANEVEIKVSLYHSDG
jgi:polyisoprenoid-binding protein YceI